MNIKTFITFIALTFPFFSFSTDYTDDANEVDFYVPGILANDGMQMVNFLLCFMESTNFATFLDKGKYAALVDEVICEGTSGADGDSEAASASGGSAGVSAAGGGNEISASKYTYGVYDNKITGSNAGGEGWVQLIMDIGESDTAVKSTAFLKVEVIADKSATNQYGTFNMTYDIRNDEAFTHEFQFNVPAGTVLTQGYLEVNGSEIKYVEQEMADPLRRIMGNFADPNNQQGYIVTDMTIEQSGPGNLDKIYSIEHQVSFDESKDQYCQKFIRAQEYQFNPSNISIDGGVSPIGSVLNNAAVKSLIDTALAANNYVSTAGGSATTVYDEHCWDTRQSQAKRMVYEYGTYNTDESRYDLTTPSLNLVADAANNPGIGITNPIWVHASYWGTHVDRRDRALLEANPNMQFKNQRNPDSTDIYNLSKDYVEVEKRTETTNALRFIDGTSFQWYIKHYSDEWQTKLQALDSTNGITAIGTCTAAGGCPEYKGSVSFDSTTSVVTFTLTEGMDWDASPEPIFVTLTNPITFTNSDWETQMVISGWTRGMHFWSPDSHAGFDIPYTAMQNPTSTLAADAYSTHYSTKMNLQELTTELNGASLVCLSECLSPSKMNTALAAAFTEYDGDQNGSGNYSENTLPFTPYNSTGPYFKEATYIDDNTPVGPNGSDPTFPAGQYNNIGGVTSSELSQYSVTASNITSTNVGDTGNLTWSDANETKIDNGKYRNQLRQYQYYSKDPAITNDNWTRDYNYSFNMRAISSVSLDSTKCPEISAGQPSRGYNANWKFTSSNAQAQDDGTYYCEWKLDQVETVYDIRVKLRPNYIVTQGSSFATISPPETFEYTVPAGLTYNFENTDMTGQKIKLKFEGFGELHNFPGRVVNTCTDTVLGKYYRGTWNNCLRYIHEFIIPEGSVLTNIGIDSTGPSSIKVRPLKGDEYLDKFTILPTDRARYDQTDVNLPQASSFKNLGLPTDSDYIGAFPTTGILNDGEPSVIHGKTVVTP